MTEHSGQKEKFIAAIKDNEGFIYKLASAYTNNTDDRHDLVQEIIYQLWKSFQTFSEQSKLSTWIYRVALNVSIYQLKKSKKTVSTVPIDEQALNYQENTGNESEEKWKVFRQQIENLNLLDKGIVMLYLDNKSYDEIAEIIGISKSNVGTKLLRIKEKLKQQINKTL
jgi:RNA polymerase sigma factor (sigma-70 family)